MMKTRVPKHVEFIFSRLFEWTEFDGFGIGVHFGARSEGALVRQKVIDGLTLLRKIDPRRYRYMQRDVKRILLLGSAGNRGQWINPLALCNLTYTYIQASDTTPELVAAILVHEAMHARLCRWGIEYEEEQRLRIEHICLKAEIAFARRLPLSEKVARKTIMSTAHRLMEWKPDHWTDLGMLEHQLRTLHKEKMPAWLMVLARRNLRARIRRLEKTKARSN